MPKRKVPSNDAFLVSRRSTSVHLAQHCKDGVVCFDLNNCRGKPNVLRWIVENVKSIHTVFLYQLFIKDDLCVELLCKIIQSVQKLYIRGGSLHRHSTIGTAIVNSKTLLVLELTALALKSNIWPRIATGFANGEVNKTLQYLRICDSTFGDNCIEFFQQATIKLPRISTLHLVRIGMAQEYHQSLENLIKWNWPRLTNFDVMDLHRRSYSSKVRRLQLYNYGSVGKILRMHQARFKLYVLILAPGVLSRIGCKLSLDIMRRILIAAYGDDI